VTAADKVSAQPTQWRKSFARWNVVATATTGSMVEGRHEMTRKTIAATADVLEPDPRGADIARHENPPLISVRHLSKTFAATRAIDDVSLDIEPGEIHALVGHNGSGKSTLIKVLSGFHAPDPGATFQYQGADVELETLHGLQASGHQARRLSFVHQDLGMVLELDVMDNLALHSRYITRWGVVDRRRQERRARELLEPFGLRVDLHAPVGSLSQLDRTVIAIAAALDSWDFGNGVLVLDEPTSSLPASHSRSLLAVLRDLRAAGAGILFVSHRLDEVLDVSDRVTVLRDGRRVATAGSDQLSKADLVHLMMGEGVDSLVGAASGRQSSRSVLQVDGLSGGPVAGISFTLGEGEILGFAGLPGSGASEVPRLLTDRRHDIEAGAITGPDGVTHPAASWKGTDGIALVPSDRLRFGSIAEMSVAENLSLSVLSRVSRFGVVRSGREADVTDEWTARMSIVCSSTSAAMSTLSGGNQQKVLLARAMAREPAVLALCEPTEGVDIGASQTIYSYVKEQAEAGLAAIVTSVDTEDLVALCHRVLIVRQGRVVREIIGQDITERRLVHAIEGVDEAGDVRERP